MNHSDPNSDVFGVTRSGIKPRPPEYLWDRGNPPVELIPRSWEKDNPWEKKAQHKRAAPVQLASLGPDRWQEAAPWS